MNIDRVWLLSTGSAVELQYPTFPNSLNVLNTRHYTDSVKLQSLRAFLSCQLDTWLKWDKCPLAVYILACTITHFDQLQKTWKIFITFTTCFSMISFSHVNPSSIRSSLIKCASSKSLTSHSCLHPYSSSWIQHHITSYSLITLITFNITPIMHSTLWKICSIGSIGDVYKCTLKFVLCLPHALTLRPTGV